MISKGYVLQKDHLLQPPRYEPDHDIRPTEAKSMPLGLQKILVLLPRQCCFEIAMPKMSPLIRLHHRSSLIIPSPPSNIKAPVGTPCLATSSNAATAASLCAGHAQQLGGGESLLPAQPDGGEGLAKCKGYRREAVSEGSIEQTRESMDKNRIQGASVGRAGNVP